ncbi:putative DNA helicase [Helianthus annuus]|nr:putative DNA helicase [Helianthus annuus]
MTDLRAFGKEKGWCPYFLARHMVQFANVVVYSYQYLLDPKVAGIISKEMQRESVVVFDEAHNIDNVCIEALSVSVRKQTIEGATRNINKMAQEINRFKATDAGRLRAEYNRLVDGLAQRGDLPTGDTWLANPALPDDILKEAVPGNIRRAEHFLSVLRRLVQYLKGRLDTDIVEKEGPLTFVNAVNSHVGIDQKMLKFCYDRLHSLMLTLEITDTDEFLHIQTICDFATLVGTYTRGFSIIIEPYDERMPHIPDPVLQLSCHDASLAIKPVFDRFQSVVITSGTLSPIDLYPRLLNFNPVVSRSFTMSLTRDCICPMVLSRGSDQLPVSTKFDLRSDPGVERNYGRLLLEMVSVVPDGIVCFFVSYSYMDAIVNSWNETGILKDIMQRKLVFIETQDVVETTLALDNYRKACDCGRGAVFFSVARGKVAEGIDFDRHYGRLVIMFGVPFQYTLSKILLARLEYLRETFQIKEGDFLTFDALRQAAQCVGRVIRSKADYGMMIFADKRYTRHDKRSKLPGWILSHLRDAHLNLSTDMAVHIAREFLRKMAQPYDKTGGGKKTLLSQEDLEKMNGANFARWEPWCGNYGFRSPWRKHEQIAELLRELASLTLSQGCLSSRLQPSTMMLKAIKDPCKNVGLSLGLMLGELGESVMKTERNKAKILIGPELQTMKLTLMQVSNSELQEIENLAIANFLFLLMEIVDKVEELAKEVAALVGPQNPNWVTHIHEYAYVYTHVWG